MSKKNFHYEYAKSILQKPIAEAEKDIAAIRFCKGDKFADDVISQFSRVMADINGGKQNGQ